MFAINATVTFLGFMPNVSIINVVQLVQSTINVVVTFLGFVPTCVTAINALGTIVQSLQAA